MQSLMFADCLVVPRILVAAASQSLECASFQSPNCPKLNLCQDIRALEKLKDLSLEERLAVWQSEIISSHGQTPKGIDLACLSDSHGHRRTSLRSKTRVFMHMLGLICKDRPMLGRLLKAIVSVHTDYGTEIGLTRLAPASFDSVSPCPCKPSESATASREGQRIR